MEAFTENLENSLAAGAFRLVLVLDEAPDELSQVAGYLESIAPDLLLDLVTVDAYNVEESVFMVPRRIEPGRPGRVDRGTPGAVVTEKVTGSLSPGTEDFEASVDDAPEDQKSRFEMLVQFAKDLEARGLAGLATYHAVRPGQLTLLPRLKDTGAGLVTIWNDSARRLSPSGEAHLRARSPSALEELEEVSPVPVGQGTRTTAITPELLDILARAYEEATTTQARRIDLDACGPGGEDSERQMAELRGRGRGDGRYAREWPLDRTVLSTDKDVSVAHVHRVLLEDGSVSPNWRGTLGGPEECRRKLEEEGISFTEGRANPAARISVKELEPAG